MPRNELFDTDNRQCCYALFITRQCNEILRIERFLILIIINIVVIIQRVVDYKLGGHFHVFFKMKTARIGFVVVFVVILVFGLALMGSVLSAKPQNLPVAIVVLDQPAKLPDGSTLAVGEMVKEKLKGIAELPVKWVEISSEAELATQLDEQKVYGALVLPVDLSSGIASLQSPSPKPAAIRIVLNEGTNTQAVSAVRMVLQQATNMLSSQLAEQLLEQIGQHAQQMPVSAASALLHPFQVTEQVVHPAGLNNANGGAPNLLVQILWLACMVTSAFMFVTAGQHGKIDTASPVQLPLNWQVACCSFQSPLRSCCGWRMPGMVWHLRSLGLPGCTSGSWRRHSSSCRRHCSTGSACRR